MRSLWTISLGRFLGLGNPASSIILRFQVLDELGSVLWMVLGIVYEMTNTNIKMSKTSRLRRAINYIVLYQPNSFSLVTQT